MSANVIISDAVEIVNCYAYVGRRPNLVQDFHYSYQVESSTWRKIIVDTFDSSKSELPLAQHWQQLFDDASTAIMHGHTVAVHKAYIKARMYLVGSIHTITLKESSHWYGSGISKAMISAVTSSALATSILKPRIYANCRSEHSLHSCGCHGRQVNTHVCAVIGSRNSQALHGLVTSVERYKYFH